MTLFIYILLFFRTLNVFQSTTKLKYEILGERNCYEALMRVGEEEKTEKQKILARESLAKRDSFRF